MIILNWLPPLELALGVGGVEDCEVDGAAAGVVVVCDGLRFALVLVLVVCEVGCVCVFGGTIGGGLLATEEDDDEEEVAACEPVDVNSFGNDEAKVVDPSVIIKRDANTLS